MRVWSSEASVNCYFPPPQKINTSEHTYTHTSSLLTVAPCPKARAPLPPMKYRPSILSPFCTTSWPRAHKLGNCTTAKVNPNKIFSSFQAWIQSFGLLLSCPPQCHPHPSRKSASNKNFEFILRPLLHNYNFQGAVLWQFWNMVQNKNKRAPISHCHECGSISMTSVHHSRVRVHTHTHRQLFHTFIQNKSKTSKICAVNVFSCEKQLKFLTRPWQASITMGGSRWCIWTCVCVCV